MGYYLSKIAITVALVVLASEIAKRSSFFGALLASVPLVSVLTILWLYIDTGSTEKVQALCTSVFWLVLPSLALFIALPLLLRHGVAFYPALVVSIALTVLCYGGMLAVLTHFGIRM